MADDANAKAGILVGLMWGLPSTLAFTFILHFPWTCPPKLSSGLPPNCTNILGGTRVPVDEAMAWASVLGAIFFAGAWAYYAYKET